MTNKILSAEAILARSLTDEGDYRALPCEVLKPSYGSCSNHGVTETATTILVICPDGHERSSSTRYPVFRLRDDGPGGYRSLVQCDAQGKQRDGWPMFGGCYAKGDSRFSVLNEYPLPIHDRYETPEQSQLLSI